MINYCMCMLQCGSLIERKYGLNWIQIQHRNHMNTRAFIVTVVNTSVKLNYVYKYLQL